VKTVYKGYEIDVHRDKCLGGWSQLYYSIFRISDGFECLSSFEDSAETIRSMIKNLKERIDNEENEADPWGENDLKPEQAKE
jgi:hypothetical protein